MNTTTKTTDGITKMKQNPYSYNVTVYVVEVDAEGKHNSTLIVDTYFKEKDMAKARERAFKSLQLLTEAFSHSPDFDGFDFAKIKDFKNYSYFVVAGCIESKDDNYDSWTFYENEFKVDDGAEEEEAIFKAWVEANS